MKLEEALPGLANKLFLEGREGFCVTCVFMRATLYYARLHTHIYKQGPRGTLQPLGMWHTDAFVSVMRAFMRTSMRGASGHAIVMRAFMRASMRTSMRTSMRGGKGCAVTRAAGDIAWRRHEQAALSCRRAGAVSGHRWAAARCSTVRCVRCTAHPPFSAHSHRGRSS